MDSEDGIVVSQSRVKQNLEALFLEEWRWQGLVPRVIFWNDTEGEFRDVYEALAFESLPALQKYELTDHNAWFLKQRLHGASAEDSFLIYQASEVPPRREDWLLDARLYGLPFSAERSEMLQQELGFTHREIKAFLVEHSAFFNAQERLRKLQAFQPQAEIAPETLQLYMMAVVLNLKHPDAATIVQRVLQDGFVPETNRSWQNLNKYFAPEAFFKLCEETLRLPERPEHLKQVFRQVAVTHFGHAFTETLPQQWQNLSVEPSNACFRFVDRWIHDARIQAQWFSQAQEIAQELQLDKLLDKVQPEAYIACETFESLDQTLITALRDLLLAGERQRCETLLAQRQTLSVSERYQPFYRGLEAAAALFSAAESTLPTTGASAAEWFGYYQQVGYRLDQAYRQYWQAAMGLSEHPLWQTLHPKIEQVYREAFQRQSEGWDDCLAQAGVWPLPLPQQTDFFEQQVWRLSNQGEQRTVVIISDAMRYEVAQELQTQLMDLLPGQSEINAMAGVLPSRTHFGMAALLPRPEGTSLALDAEPDLRIAIAGQRPENTESRDKLLQAAGQARGHKALRAFRYSDVVSLNREAGRELSKSFQVAYIYHDQIDATGDKPANQDQVFKACENTLSDLLTLIKRLVHWNVGQILVTADHGFLYQYEAPGEHDKIDLPADTLLSKRRCALATAPVSTPGVLSLQLQHYTQPHDALYALIPRGGQRFRKQGGSSKYAHGGSSLQEVCVPLLTYNHVKATLNATRPKTGVRVLAPQRRITNNVFSLSLLQEQPVNEQYRPRQVQVFFENEAGQVISNRKTVLLDAESSHAPEREHRVSLTLSTAESRTYARLRIVDDEEDYDVIEPERWEINLSFSNDFGF